MSFGRERGFKGKEKEELVEGVLIEERDGDEEGICMFMVCRINLGIVREVECGRVGVR